jgi:hypothetical protein
MKNKKGKVTTIDWGEMIIPVCFLILCLTYIVQVVDLSPLSLIFAMFCLLMLIPTLILIIVKFAVHGVKEEKVIRKHAEAAKSRLRSFVSLKETDKAEVKQFRFVVVYVICFGVVGYLFGFIFFTPAFIFFTLMALGVKRLAPLIGITLATSLFMYVVFDRLLMFPLPRGILR